MDLYRDWLNIVQEVFKGSGSPLPDDLTDEEVAIAYFLQTAPSEQAAGQLAESNEQRLRSMQQTILDRLDDVIAPDIKKRTGYEGTQFHFQWVYQQGEHIVENRSQYRIPL
jgi:hypothetical protein